MVNSDRVATVMVPLVGPMINRVKHRRRAQFEVLPVPSGRVLFLGDSLTQEGLWEEWFPDLDTLNRGISGDTVGGVLDRLDVAVNAPVAISLLIGTNDLTGFGGSRKVKDIVAQFRELVTTLVTRAPNARLLINSVMPRTAWFAARVQALNEHYRSIATDVGATYIDLWPVLAGPDLALRPVFTQDNLHLNGAGYRVWTDALRSHLAEFARLTEVSDQPPGAAG